MVALLGEELDRETTDIADSVCTPLFRAGSAKTEQHLCFLPNAVQELG